MPGSPQSRGPDMPRRLSWCADRFTMRNVPPDHYVLKLNGRLLRQFYVKSARAGDTIRSQLSIERLIRARWCMHCLLDPVRLRRPLGDDYIREQAAQNDE